MYVNGFVLICIDFFFFLLHSFFSLLVQNPVLCSDGGGESVVVTSGKVDVWAVDKVVFLHVHALGVRGLLPLLAHSPAWAGATEPDPFVVLPCWEGRLGGGQTLFLLLRRWDVPEFPFLDSSGHG